MSAAMNSDRPRVFLSHSFDRRSKRINDWFLNMIKAMGMEPVTVSVHRHDIKVSEEVRSEIRDSRALVAVATRSGKAPHEIRPWIILETALADSWKKPIVVFAEDGVDMGPLQGDPVTRFEYRHMGQDSVSIVEALAELRCDICRPRELFGRLHAMHVRNFFNIPEENDVRDTYMEEALAKHTSKLRLMARSGYSYLHHGGWNWDKGVKSHLDSGSKMDVILQGPFSPNGLARREAESKTKRKIREFHDISLDRLCDLTDIYKDRLRIRFTALPMFCSLFFTDPAVFYDPYHYGRMNKGQRVKNNFFVAEFTRPRKDETASFYAILDRHFKYVWRHPKQTLSLAKFCKRKGT